MATKLKKSRPGTAFVLFALSLTIVVAAMAGGLYLWAAGVIALDYKETPRYQQAVNRMIADAYAIAENGPDGDAGLTLRNDLNVDYFIEGRSFRLWSDTVSDATAKAMYERVNSNMDAAGYAHVIYAADGVITQQMQTSRGQGSNAAAYQWPGSEQQNSFCLAIRPESGLVNYGLIYDAYYQWYYASMLLAAGAAVVAVALIILLCTLVRRRTLAEAHRSIAAALGHIWMEPKLMLLLGSLTFGAWTAVDTFAFREIGTLPGLAVILACFWCAWLLLTDLSVNGIQAFFSNNSFMSAARFLRGLESRHDFLARMKRRLILLLAAECVLAVPAGFLTAWILLDWIEEIWIAVVLVLAALGLFLLFSYVREYNRNMDDFGRVVDYVEQMRSGSLCEPLCVNGDFAGLAADLNDIMDGVNRAVEEQMRSERMKIELVTNVSHDLKTPLTSIINYVDLLGREQLSPDFANDYVQIIDQKAKRLKNLVQDLFEISKANSGAIDAHPEQIDVVSLVDQTIAEMDARTSGIEIKPQFAAARLFVWADGKMLHRVFENLLGNALKYSMSGTRVYVSVRQDGDSAEVSFKNIANYEMTFSADDIVERFQRGDASRTGEGSGLGLAIAKSFTELSGGTLRIELDGDLFKAIVTLPLCAQDIPEALEAIQIQQEAYEPQNDGPPCGLPDDPQEQLSQEKAPVTTVDSVENE
ncbi:sensor histidine kinase [Anaerotruncus colihominis]|uniref:histidine kinase n=1 Tax=Anaerotruncus colihominis TaxID=169435 RepID=A0A845RMC6_9FIRM|nr:HAMP domain-containing sensor histidine kinase [Anaerotruncus colihominis]NBI79931.1 sensor histidine kinase [Anaerotruncus colihominis]